MNEGCKTDRGDGDSALETQGLKKVRENVKHECKTCDAIDRCTFPEGKAQGFCFWAVWQSQ